MRSPPGGRPISLKCVFVAWILGWATAVYLPSALIAAAHLSPLADGRSLPAATFAVADEVAPFAKIGFALAFALLLLGTRKLSVLRRLTAALTDAALAAAAMLLTLTLLPADWSRGFGIGLTGVRFSPDVTAIYLLGAALAGVVFAISEGRCVGRGTGGKA
jgi:hypothetical protein